MGRIFISYRRDDSAGHAGRVHDRLVSEFGPDLLFMDVDAIPLGRNFAKVLRDEVAKCDALLAIIGPGWLDMKSESGSPRLDDPNDFVRIEIAAALSRDIPVIPVFLEGARPPRSEALPADLKELALRNGLEVRHASFHADMDKLIRSLKGQRPTAAAQKPPPAPAAPEAAPPGSIRVEVGAGSASSARYLYPGASFKDMPDTPEMVLVPPGEFLMGSPSDEAGRNPFKAEAKIEEAPIHKVTIKKPFAVGRYPVTVEQFSTFATETGWQDGGTADVLNIGWFSSDFTSTKGASFRSPGYPLQPGQPVTCVNWSDARDYVAWLTRRTSRAYRLLSEAEWEYACRAGTTTPFATGTSISGKQAHYGPSFTKPHPVPVGSFPPNAFGLFDMHGNVFEWCEDACHVSYQGAPTDGSPWVTATAATRVTRGGHWASPENFLRSACRCNGFPAVRNNTIGIRVARDL